MDLIAPHSEMDIRNLYSQLTHISLILLLLAQTIPCQLTVTGVPGEVGATGLPGAPGLPGAQGAKGDEGPPGAPGIQVGYQIMADLYSHCFKSAHNIFLNKFMSLSAVSSSQ